MSSFSWKTAETAVTRFTRGHFSELIQKDVGGEGVLYAAKHDIHGNVMVKVFTSPENKYSEQEVKTLVKVADHQNIVSLLGSFYFEDGTDAMRSGYVMEFMANGSLSAVIHDLSIQYNNNQVYSWIQQASRGITYLHSQKIIHRDVNTRNMLLGETIDVLKISDFGLAKPDAITTERNTCFMGTIVYMAPEVINDQGVNSAADVYSLGISTWEMFHRKKPFFEYDSLSRFSLCSMIINGTRPKIELIMEEEVKNLILRSLNAEYTQRPKASDFTTIAVKLRIETIVSPNALKAQKASLVEDKSSLMTIVNHAIQYIAKGSTSPSHPLSSEIQNSFDSKLTLLIGGIANSLQTDDTVLAFEHNTNTWKELVMKIPEYGCRGAVVLDQQLYAFGKEKKNASLFKLNLEDRSWMELINIPKGRNYDFFPSVTYESKIYIAMGCTVFAYDPVGNSWSELAPFKDIAKLEGIAVFNNKLYIFVKCRNLLFKAGYYDAVENEWKYLSLDVPAPFVKTLAVTYKNELLFADNRYIYASNIVEKTPWKTLPQLKFSPDSATIFTCQDSLFAAGGNLGGGKCSNEVESFDGKIWAEMPRMPYALMRSKTVTATGDLAKQLLKLFC